MKGSKNAPENRGTKNLAVVCSKCDTKIKRTRLIKGGKKRMVNLCNCAL